MPGIEFVLANQYFALDHVSGEREHILARYCCRSTSSFGTSFAFSSKDRLFLARVFGIAFCRVSDGARGVMKSARARM